MNKADAKALLKNSGKKRDEIRAIYNKYVNALAPNFRDADFNRAITLALAEAAGIPPGSFHLGGNTVNAVAELMDR